MKDTPRSHDEGRREEKKRSLTIGYCV